MKTATGLALAIAVNLMLVSSQVTGQASKKLEEATKRMESPQKKMEQIDKLNRDADRVSTKRGVVDKRKNPNERPGLKRMVLPGKK